MTTPFKTAQPGLEDSFNFHHSSLRISIECAFGMLVHKWGCLRKPIPMNISLQKICALVRCLCILHNFCIDERLKRENRFRDDTSFVEMDSTPRTMSDRLSILIAGGAINERLDTNFNNYDNDLDRPNEFLDGGNHFEDIPFNVRREYVNAQNRRIDEFPRNKMLRHLQYLNLTQREAPRGSTSSNRVVG